MACPAHPTDFTDGVATVDVTFITAGPQTITATDSLIYGISDPITVDPAGLDHFVVNHVDDQVAGTATDVTATAQDLLEQHDPDLRQQPDHLRQRQQAPAPPRLTGSFGTVSSGVGTAPAPSIYTAKIDVKQTFNDGTLHSESKNITVRPQRLSLTSAHDQRRRLRRQASFFWRY